MPPTTISSSQPLQPLPLNQHESLTLPHSLPASPPKESRQETQSQALPSLVMKKPDWSPNELVQQDFQDFSNSLLDRQFKPLAKSANIPHTIDDILWRLHSRVKEHYQDGDISFMKKTSGYYEKIVELLGGKVPVGRLRMALQHLELKISAQKLKDELSVTIGLFKRDIVSHIIEESPPIDNAGASESIQSQETQAGEDVPVIYRFRCKWDAHLRSLLVRIEDIALKWIVVENNYRTTMIAADKQGKDPHEVGVNILLWLLS